MPEQSFVSSPQKKDSKILWYVLGGVFILASVLGGVIWWYGSNMIADTKPMPTPVVSKKSATPAPVIPTPAAIVAITPVPAASIPASPSATVAAINMVTSSMATQAAVNAVTSSVKPSASVLASASVMPSVSPSSTLAATPRSVPVDTGSGVPVTGVIEDTVRGLAVGFGLLMLGLLIL